ncbi:hypothetical protein AB0I60_05780 [Actinosynnema sp. NPDC050436]|uniref:hypothetical protein n=1 Tax=Actinosynnema sp. NPDC050436 TaxID=3155659 RepID=UPI0033DFBE4F
MTDVLDHSALRDGDRAALRHAGRVNARLRAVLCTLARRGVALRQDDPPRGRQILDALAPWPFYKGGQFLFDLLEWEDFMIDGEPPPVLSPAELGTELRTALDVPALRGVVHGLTEALTPPPADPAPASDTGIDDTPVGVEVTVGDALPPLEGGFRLYQDVVLGLFDVIGPRLPRAAEPEPPVPGEPDRGPDTAPEGTAEDDAATTTPEPARPVDALPNPVFPIVESFRVTAPEQLDHRWTLRGDAALTGDGLELTPAAQRKSGTALLDTPFPSAAGVTVDFDFYCAGGSGDGFAVYLVDGAHDTDAGGYGDGLGYALDRTGHDGVTRGWIGLGFDKWGNFSRATAGPTPKDARKPGHVVLRGSGDRRSGFDLIRGVPAPGGLNAVWEDRAHVQVVVVDAVVTVRVTRGDTTTTVFDAVDLTLVPGQEPMPETFKLGLSACTGGKISRHCVRDLAVTLPAAVPLAVDGPAEVPAGSRAAFVVTVRNDGPNDVPDAVVTGTFAPSLADVDVEVSQAGAVATIPGSVGEGVFRQQLDLPVGGTATVTATGTVDREATGEVTCAAVITTSTRGNTAPVTSDSHTARLAEPVSDPVTEDVSNPVTETEPVTEPVTVDEPETEQHVPADDLRVCLHAAPSVAPGAEGNLAVSVENPDGTPVDVARAELVFDAPTGFEWTGRLSFTYYHAGGGSEGSGGTALEPALEQDGRRLRLTGLQRFRTHEGYVLTYVLGIRAKADARPGRRTDGTAVVGDSRPLSLAATVQGTAQPQSFANDDAALPVVQPALLEAKPGESGFMAVTVGFQRAVDSDVGSLGQVFRAPSGFRWNGYVSYSYYSGGRHTQGGQADIRHRVTGGGSVLEITGMPALRASQGLYLTYVLGLTADGGAAPGLRGDGEARIGDARPLALHAEVVDRAEPSRCNR